MFRRPIGTNPLAASHTILANLGGEIVLGSSGSFELAANSTPRQARETRLLNLTTASDPIGGQFLCYFN